MAKIKVEIIILWEKDKKKFILFMKNNTHKNSFCISNLQLFIYDLLINLKDIKAKV
jgi:hypothetical protein